MNKIMSFLAGGMCGAIVGSVAALLLAPMSGKELQTQTRDRFDDLVADARQAADERRKQLEAQLSSLKGPQPAPASTPTSGN